MSIRILFPPLLTVFAALVSTYLLWNMAGMSELEHFQSEAKSIASGVAGRLEAHIETRLDVVAGLKEDWESGAINGHEEFRDRATRIHGLFGDLQALNWVSPEGVNTVVTPLEGNKGAIGLDVMEIPGPAVAIAKAKEINGAQLTAPLILAQSGYGFVGYSPLFDGKSVSGYLNIVFRSAPLVAAATEGSIPDTHLLEIFDGDSSVIEPVLSDEDRPQAARATVDLFGREWTILILPTPQYISETRSPTGKLILIAGALISLLLGGQTYILLRRRQALSQSEQRFRDFAAAGADWLWEMGPDLRYTYLSPDFQSQTGLDTKTVLGKTQKEFLNQSHDKSEVDIHFQELGQNQPFRGFECKILGGNGEQSIISLSGSPIFDKRGNLEAYRGTGRNVTDERKIEEQLKAAMRRELREVKQRKEQSDAIAIEFDQHNRALQGLTESVREISALTKKVDALSEEVQETAAQGNSVGESARRAMNEVTNASDNIAKSNDAIETIAFQTDLLALNAMVEAARAGSAGRGFAVVASEVQALSSRTKTAAEDVKKALSTGISQALKGRETVTEATGSLHEISEKINKSSEMVSELSHKVSQQLNAIEKISDASRRIDQRMHEVVSSRNSHNQGQLAYVAE